MKLCWRKKLYAPQIKVCKKNRESVCVSTNLNYAKDCLMNQKFFSPKFLFYFSALFLGNQTRREAEKKGQKSKMKMLQVIL